MFKTGIIMLLSFSEEMRSFGSLFIRSEMRMNMDHAVVKSSLGIHF